MTLNLFEMEQFLIDGKVRFIFKITFEKKVSFNKIDFKLSSRLKDLLKEYKSFLPFKDPQ